MADLPEASRTKPANANQLATVAKLCRLLKLEDTVDLSWSSWEASQEITRLSRIYNQRESQKRRR